MTHSDDVGRPRRRGRKIVSVALVVLAAAGWARAVGAAGVPGRIGVDSVSALAIDPHNPATLYAVGVCGTAVKSTDGGGTWIVANTGLISNNIIALAIDPFTPGTLYAGTNNFGRVFKSTDGASSWHATAGPPDYVSITQALAIDPSMPRTLYAGASDAGVFKSTDGGSSWHGVNAGLARSNVGVLAIDPTLPSTLYAATYDAGVFKSTDGACSWHAVNTGLTVNHVNAIAIDPTAPSTLYVGTSDAGVFKGTDGASSWHNTGLARSNVSVLAIDPTMPSTLYAGTYDAGVFKSTDGASSWHAVNVGLAANDVSTLAIDPTMPSTLYAGTHGGVFESTDGASSWHATGLEGGPICGDSLRCWPEECDDGNTVSADGCDANCTVTRCGNAIVTAGEECDDGNLLNGDRCEANCILARCGNSIVDTGEECDDGNAVSGDGCDANCTLPRCGNGVVDAGEECDDGNNNPSDGCTNACTICGNGMVTPPEECEDGNTNPSDGCTNACTICGNGIVTAPEECDDGNLVNGDGCEANCHSGCGNGVREGDEECDDGGTCIGSVNAGTHCTAESDCPGGHCQTFGGDGCAVNCTLESDVPFNLAPGVVEGPDIVAATSGAVIHGDILTIPLPFNGSQTLTIGKERDGRIPVVIRAAAVHFARVPVGGNFGCACPRAVAAKTCGGTAFESDGVTQSPNCTPGFTAGDSVCAGKPPCAFLHGPGNSASGVIGCNGLDGVNVSLIQDAGGESRAPGPPLLTLSGTGGPGAALLSATTAIGGRIYRSGPCTLHDESLYGADGEFCTDDDPQSQRGSPVTGAVTTGTITGRLLNANQLDGNDIGPFSLTGQPFNCSALADRSAAGAALASASVELARQTLGDVVTTNLLVEGRPAPSPTPGPGALVGDCHGDGQVTVDELLTMVNIVLGTAQLSACPPITTWAAGSGVNVALIIQAVNAALSS